MRERRTWRQAKRPGAGERNAHHRVSAAACAGIFRRNATAARPGRYAAAISSCCPDANRSQPSAVPRQQPLFGRRMRFDRAVMEDMAHRNALRPGCARPTGNDDNPAVRAPRTSGRRARAAAWSRSRPAKLRLLRHRFIVGDAIAIERSSAAGRRANHPWRVGDPFVRQTRRKRHLREPGKSARKGIVRTSATAFTLASAAPSGSDRGMSNARC